MQRTSDLTDRTEETAYFSTPGIGAPGGPNRARTGDPLLAGQVLSLLSYKPIRAMLRRTRPAQLDYPPLKTTLREKTRIDYRGTPSNSCSFNLILLPLYFGLSCLAYCIAHLLRVYTLRFQGYRIYFYWAISPYDVEIRTWYSTRKIYPLACTLVRRLR